MIVLIANRTLWLDRGARAPWMLTGPAQVLTLKEVAVRFGYTELFLRDFILETNRNTPGAIRYLRMSRRRDGWRFDGLALTELDKALRDDHPPEGRLQKTRERVIR